MSENKILVDTNYLLLFVVGKTDKRLITKNKERFRKYDIPHFEILDLFIANYSKIVVTPHILTEFWYFMGKSKGSWDTDWDRIYRMAHMLIENVCEIPKYAKELIKHNEIKWLGIADVSLLAVAKDNGYKLLTDDSELRNHAQSLGIERDNLWQHWDKYK